MIWNATSLRLSFSYYDHASSSMHWFWSNSYLWLDPCTDVCGNDTMKILCKDMHVLALPSSHHSYVDSRVSRYRHSERSKSDTDHSFYDVRYGRILRDGNSLFSYSDHRISKTFVYPVGMIFWYHSRWSSNVQSRMCICWVSWIKCNFFQVIWSVLQVWKSMRKWFTSEAISRDPSSSLVLICPSRPWSSSCRIPYSGTFHYPMFDDTFSYNVRFSCVKSVTFLPTLFITLFLQSVPTRPTRPSYQFFHHFRVSLQSNVLMGSM